MNLMCSAHWDLLIHSKSLVLLSEEFQDGMLQSRTPTCQEQDSQRDFAKTTP